MAILANRIRTKNHILELFRFVFSAIKKSFIVMFIITACYLMYFSYPRVIARGLLEAVGTTLSACHLLYSESVNITKSTYDKLAYFQNLKIENLKLKLEIELLRQKEQSRFVLQAENSALKDMLNVAKNLSNQFVTAKVVGVSFSPFSSVATIESGSKSGVKINDIVQGRKGLVGRVTEVSDHYAKVMLINDQDSRIPVFAPNAKARGILAKQDDSLKIIYINEDHDLSPGALIYTSGAGSIIARGLPVAIVTNVTNGSVFVKAIEDFNNLNFVFIKTTLEDEI